MDLIEVRKRLEGIIFVTQYKNQEIIGEVITLISDIRKREAQNDKKSKI